MPNINIADTNWETAHFPNPAVFQQRLLDPYKEQQLITHIFIRQTKQIPYRYKHPTLSNPINAIPIIEELFFKLGHKWKRWEISAIVIEEI